MQQCILESVDLWHQSGFLCILLDSIQLPRYLVVYLLLMLCGVFFLQKSVFINIGRGDITDENSIVQAIK